MEALVQWLEREKQALEADRKPDAYNAGYYGAITNVLDFIQGAEVFSENA